MSNEQWARRGTRNPRQKIGWLKAQGSLLKAGNHMTGLTGFIPYILQVLGTIIIFALVILGMNLSIGFTGMLSVSHIAFFGIGAYVAAISFKLGFGFIEALFIGVVITTILSYILARATVKLKSDYLAVASLTLIFMVQIVAQNWDLAGGVFGIKGVNKVKLPGFEISPITNQLGYVTLMLIMLAIVFFLLKKLVNSKLGLIFKGIRDDETAMRSLGYNTEKFKTLSLIISSIVAMIAGILYAHFITVVVPTLITFNDLLLVLGMLVIGGLGSLEGSIVGTVIFYSLPELLRFVSMPEAIVGLARYLVLSVILLIVLYIKPRGLLGKVDISDAS